MKPNSESSQALEEQFRAYARKMEDTERLYAAFQYADLMRASKLRADGKPYITHPLAVIAALLEEDEAPSP